jgi:DNA invertase Pin-like site-specific DNA recombinase
MLIGYARVSTVEQDLRLQTEQLRKLGCNPILTEIASGARGDRPRLREAIEKLGPDDTLVVWKLDRLGRSVKGLVDFVAELGERKAHLRSVTDNISTTDAHGKFFFHVMAAFAEMERELIIERTRAGLAAAKTRGRLGGRPRVMTTKKVEVARKLLADGMPIRDVAETLEVSIPTLYRWLPANARNNGASA